MLKFWHLENSGKNALFRVLLFSASELHPACWKCVMRFNGKNMLKLLISQSMFANFVETLIENYFCPVPQMTHEHNKIRYHQFYSYYLMRLIVMVQDPTEFLEQVFLIRIHPCSCTLNGHVEMILSTILQWLVSRTNLALSKFCSMLLRATLNGWR